MASTYSDSALLANDVTFVGRVRQSMIAAAIAISSEGFNVLYHKQRARQCIILLNYPDIQKVYYAIAVATDANVRADATVGGTVALTPANTPAQAALVTDAHIDAAISGQFNAFFDTTP